MPPYCLLSVFANCEIFPGAPLICSIWAGSPVRVCMCVCVLHAECVWIRCIFADQMNSKWSKHELWPLTLLGGWLCAGMSWVMHVMAASCTSCEKILVIINCLSQISLGGGAKVGQIMLFYSKFAVFNTYVWCQLMYFLLSFNLKISTCLKCIQPPLDHRFQHCYNARNVKIKIILELFNLSSNSINKLLLLSIIFSSLCIVFQWYKDQCD